MQNSIVTHEEPCYKKEFYDSLADTHQKTQKEFWVPFNEQYKEPKYETAAQKRVEKKAQNKVVKSHDVWRSDAYDTGEWQNWKYRSVYTQDFTDKYEFQNWNLLLMTILLHFKGFQAQIDRFQPIFDI